METDILTATVTATAVFRVVREEHEEGRSLPAATWDASLVEWLA
jgi:hypothetical protein